MQWSDLKKTFKDAFKLTGKQNSSKAGLTNVVYCERICSRSLPRLMSRRTAGTKNPKQKRIILCLHAVCGNIWNAVSDVNLFTSTGQSDIWICVHEKLHVKHIPYFLRVEDQDPLKEDDVCWVKCDLVLQPTSMHRVNANANTVKACAP